MCCYSCAKLISWRSRGTPCGVLKACWESYSTCVSDVQNRHVLSLTMVKSVHVHHRGALIRESALPTSAPLCRLPDSKFGYRTSSCTAPNNSSWPPVHVWRAIPRRAQSQQQLERTASPPCHLNHVDLMSIIPTAGIRWLHGRRAVKETVVSS
jgi:hypothetical protein